MTEPAAGRGDAKPGLALRIGIAGALAIGAVASGYFLSRSGRRVLREAWQGRRRTRLEDRVLDRLWHDRRIGRRVIDVREIEPGVIQISGAVNGENERVRALDMVAKVADVREVEDALTVETPTRRNSRLVRRRRE
jgi:osmotically-inducible protein OsmY